MRGGGELVEEVVHALRARVGEVKGAAIEVRLVRDVVHRPHDPVDGHDVCGSQVDPHERQPLGDQAAHALDRLEEVIGAVDLVHLARLRVAHDDRRPVHAPRHVGLLAHDALGLELGEVVRRGQTLVLVEHVLAEDPPVLARDGDR